MTVHASRISTSTEVEARPIVPATRVRGLYRAGAKRLIDLFLVAISLPFIVPFFAILAAIIATDGHSPFFRQERVGKDGRRFMMWKFRTMVPNAEQQLENVLSDNPKARTEWNEKQKLSVDPRCTSVGRILRRSSLDELPQIFNVLSGDMSLVGPRPMLPKQQALYPGHAYYNLRPGMTGAWQVSARNESRFSERAHYDDLYDANLSFVGDAGIIVRTVSVVLRGTGV